MHFADNSSFCLKFLNVFIYVNIHIDCVYAIYMNDTLSHFLQMQKKFFGASNVIKISQSGPAIDINVMYTSVIIILYPFMLIQHKGKANKTNNIWKVTSETVVIVYVIF